ncbi:YdcF family protein [Nocardia sp. NPDC003345]
MGPVLLLGAGWCVAVFGAVRLVREPRRLSNGFTMLAAVVLVVAGLGSAASRIADRSPWTSAAVPVGALFLMVMVVAGIGLLTNGIGVMRREGVQPMTSTPVLAGAGLLTLSVAAAFLLLRGPAVPQWVMAIAGAVALVGVYLVAHLLAFAGYALAYGRLPDEEGVDAVIVLGCGLHRNKVTPLLAARLDRALRVYRAETARGRSPLVVTSGGKGGDEAVSEADAMAAYLITAGLAEPVIVRERESRNTEENLRNSLRLLTETGLDPAAMRVTVVTSNFHVLRAAALTRRLGVDARVVGARTARYFVPASFLREFVAVLTTHYRRSHIVMAVVAAGIPAAATVDALVTR